MPRDQHIVDSNSILIKIKNESLCCKHCDNGNGE